MMVNPKTRESISIREDVLATLRVITPHAQALNSLAALDEIERTAARVGNHASFLRARYQDSGSVEAVSVTNGPQSAGLFQPPAGYLRMDIPRLPTAPGGARPAR